MQGILNVLTVVNTVLILGGIVLVVVTAQDEEHFSDNIDSNMWFEKAYDEKHPTKKTHAAKSQTRTPKVKVAKDAKTAKKAVVTRTKKRPGTR